MNKTLFCIVSNFVFILIILAFMFTARFLPKYFIAGVIAKAILFLLLEIFAFALHNFFYSNSKSFFKTLQKIFTQATLLAVLKLALYLSLLYAFRFFFIQKSLVSILLQVVIFWVFFFIHLSLLQFFATFNEGENFFTNLKESYYAFINNPKDTLLIFAKNFLFILISPFLLFLYPSFTGVILNIKIKKK